MPTDIEIVTDDSEDEITDILDSVADIVEEQADATVEVVEELTDTIEELVEELVEAHDEPEPITSPVIITRDDEAHSRIDALEERINMLELSNTIEEIEPEPEPIPDDIAPVTKKRRFHNYWFGEDD